MITVAQLQRIEVAAEVYNTTPETRCQVAMANIYKIAGLLPFDLPIPEGPRDAGRWANRSQFRDWLDGEGAKYFQEVPAPAEPGDLLCFRLGHIEHHVAILLGGGRLVHVFGNHGVQIAPCIPDAWAKRLGSIWRLRT